MAKKNLVSEILFYTDLLGKAFLNYPILSIAILHLCSSLLTKDLCLCFGKQITPIME